MKTKIKCVVSRQTERFYGTNLSKKKPYFENLLSRSSSATVSPRLTPVGEVVLQDVKHASHLGEEQDLVPVGVERRQEFVYQDQLVARFNQVLPRHKRLRLHAWKWRKSK